MYWIYFIYILNRKCPNNNAIEIGDRKSSLQNGKSGSNENREQIKPKPKPKNTHTHTHTSKENAHNWNENWIENYLNLFLLFMS